MYLRNKIKLKVPHTLPVKTQKDSGRFRWGTDRDWFINIFFCCLFVCRRKDSNV